MILDTEMRFQNEKVRLNVGGNIFEVSLFLFLFPLYRDC